MGKKKGAALPPALAAADDGDVDALRSAIDADGMDKVLALKNKDGWNVLHIAAFAGELECVNLLIQKGCDVAVKCPDGDTPAHYASAQGHLEVVETLARKGGLRVFSLTDNDGETVADVALNAKTKRAIEALQQKLENEAEDAGEDNGDDDAEDKS